MSEKKEIFKGNLKFEINETETEAKITFSPDENGAEWTREKLIELFKEKGIQDSIDPSVIEKAIKEFAKLKEGELSVVVAEGEEPGAPEDGKIKWEKFSLPDELKDIGKVILEKAPSPRVYEVTEEKVKIEKIEKKKSFLPFLPAKEEKVVQWEKKEIKRRVGVEEKVEDFGYVKEGDLLATIIEGKPGKEGKNIFGRIIPPRKPRKVEIYVGEGIKFSGKEVRTEVAGFVRRGNNWVDIIRFNQHRIEVKTSNDRANCLLDFTPGEGNKTIPRVDFIIEKCKELGFKSEDLISKEEIEETLKNSVASGKVLRNFSLTKSEEAQIIISVDEDKLKAYLTLRKGSGKGKPLSLKEVGDKIKSYKFKGMDTERVRKDILDFYHSSKRELVRYLLVEGIPPESGEDGEIKFEFNYLSEEAAEKIKSDSEKRIEALRDIGSLEEFPISKVDKIGFVEEDTEVASIVPPKEGKPGKDVFGNVIPGKKGKEVSVKVFENLTKGRTSIVSTIRGIVELGESDGTYLLRARPHSDGSVTVDLSEDKMKAFVTVVPPEGAGAPVREEDIDRAISDAGVVKGLKEEILARVKERVSSGLGVKRVLIAEGQFPVSIQRKEPKFYVEFASGSRVRIRKDGRADYKNLDLITVVKKDQLLAEVDTSGVNPEDGWDVTGKVLPASKSVAAVLNAGKNIRVEEAEGTIKFYAEKDGELIYEKNTLEILEVHTVDGDAGPKTGNIKFTGSVVVKGSVLDGIKVIAGGDIFVDENVGASLLSADGKIVVKGGIKGADKAIIRSKKGVEAGFLEQALILSVGDVVVKGSCLRCKVKCNSRMILESDKGNLVGGMVWARRGVDANNIGSDSGVATYISFGQDYLVMDQIQLEEKEIGKLKNMIIQFDSVMNKLERSGKATEESLAKIRKQKLLALKLMEKRSHRLFILKERFEEHVPSEINVRGTFFVGARVESHGRFYEVERPKKHLILYFDTERGVIEEKKEEKKND